MGLMQNITIIVFLLNIFLAITIIFLERRNVTATWSWVLILFFIPVLGFILYLVLGQKLKKRKLTKLLGDHRIIIQSAIENQAEQMQSNQMEYADPSTATYRDILYMNLMTSQAIYTSDNEVDIFIDGNEKFDALISDIETATHHIHLIYYIVRDDALGRRLMHVLTEKAKQGLEIKFLYDHIGSSRLTKRFFAQFLEAGGEAVAFFPSRIPYLNLKINYRNHRKLVVIDGRVGYIGGFNIGDEYLGLNKNLGYWRDTHLKIMGHAVLQMQAQFLMDWNLATNSTLELIEPYFPVANYSGNGIGMQLVSSGPDSEYQQIKNAFIKLIYSARETIAFQTPYFIPDESFMTALRIAAKCGVDVKIMLPNKPDHFFVYWASNSYLGALLDVGIKVYLYENGFLHAKTLVVDGKVASVGTANLDIRSFKLNFEINAFIYDTRTAVKLMDIFEQDKEKSTELTKEMYEQRSVANRFKESISRLLSPIL
ncbi:cardiolipin synthase [Paenibacillus yanchengensis]|uniref:Cardiolipin synthase n=1 Tax=Paenibacillus yanchengensis TaxID=2035833 RepID=A0ABW4YP94_9BACL